ncbi:hypothetical protein M3Y99_01060600 [Aphelenchoides fujianensis]|nr:hypothetical protein M3Y99_01060600 [Aphelenchoides fujianensis]
MITTNSLLSFFLLAARLICAVAAVDAFPTQIFSAYGGGSGSRLGAGGGRWSGGGAGGGGARVNDNAEVARHFDRFTTTTTVPPNYNIGVIQVRLSNWTDHPLFTASTRAPNAAAVGQRRRTSRGKQREAAAAALTSRRRRPPDEDAPEDDRSRWRPLLDDDEADENSAASSTYIFQTGDPRDRSKFAHVDNTYAYVITAVFLGLVIFLTTLYLFLSCRSFCRKRRRRTPPAMTYPSPYAYYESNPWGGNQRGGDLERLFRSDLELKRPPLVAPPPLPPSIPPPPVPQHLRPHPAYTRRKYTGPPNRDSPVEREIRLQLLKRQISESTLSTRTRTNSF